MQHGDFQVVTCNIRSAQHRFRLEYWKEFLGIVREKNFAVICISEIRLDKESSVGAFFSNAVTYGFELVANRQTLHGAQVGKIMQEVSTDPTHKIESNFRSGAALLFNKKWCDNIKDKETGPYGEWASASATITLNNKRQRVHFSSVWRQSMETGLLIDPGTITLQN